MSDTLGSDATWRVEQPGADDASDPLALARELRMPLTQRLLEWFASHQRDLPWRRTHDPYAIWASEIMLQQTQVNAVIPYFARWMARFPTVQALAAAELDEVLALWQGMGYYSRARSFHAAALLICGRHNGQVPAEREALLTLPGIGAYTAGAILSIAFDQDEPLVDGNVKRVFCRVFDYAGDPESREGRTLLWDCARTLLPGGQAGAFNQALMELGATLCLPRHPLCAACPVAGLCRARALGIQEQRPHKRERRPRPHRQAVAVWIVREGQLLFARRRPWGLLGGLWELPGVELLPDETDAQALARLVLAELQLSAIADESLASVRHAYSHFSVTVRLYRCPDAGEPAMGGAWDALAWVEADALDAYGLTGVARKLLQHVPWPGQGLL